MTWRDIKRLARQTVHSTMALPCWYVPFSGATPTITKARLHSQVPKNGVLGIGDPLNQGFADIQDIQPRLVFLKEDVLPVYGDVFILGSGEGYRCDADRPPDDITVIALCVLIDKTDVDTMVTNLALDLSLLV